MPQSIVFDLERIFRENTDILDLHFAVLEGVVGFLEEYECSDSRKLVAALRVSFNLVSQRYQHQIE